MTPRMMRKDILVMMDQKMARNRDDMEKAGRESIREHPYLLRTFNEMNRKHKDLNKSG